MKNLYVSDLNKLLRLRSRTSIISFMHYLSPIPKPILNELGPHLDKLILLSFNEAVNIEQVTGSKIFLR